MKITEDGELPLKQNGEVVNDNCADTDDSATKKEREAKDKKKKKRNLWPLKALVISFILAVAVNAGSELILEGATLWLSCVITLVIVIVGVFFDIIGTATTSCDIQPYLAMASRKVKGAKMAVKLAKKADAVSSICNDIIGDICGVVSGVCAAMIAVSITHDANFWISILIYAAISTLTITLKAVGKRYAVVKANKIVFNTAKVLSVFSKD